MNLKKNIVPDDRYRSDVPELAREHITTVHPNGAPAVAEYYLDGRLVGRRQWDPDGYLTLETPLLEGRKNGVEVIRVICGLFLSISDSSPNFEPMKH